MTWEEELFGFLDELEQQAESLYEAERAPELADRSRAEYQQVSLAARLMASVTRDVALDVVGAGVVRGRLERVYAEWCLVAGTGQVGAGQVGTGQVGTGQDWVVKTTAVAAAQGCSDRAVPEVAWSPLAKLGFGSALRRLAEAGERCVVHRLDGGRHEGVLRRVGGDFVEVEEGHGAGARLTLVPFEVLVAAQSREIG